MKIKVLGTPYDMAIVKQDEYLEYESDGYCDALPLIHTEV